MVVGADAEAELQRICAANVGKEPGRVTYTQLLNARGGIEADLTVSRLAENQFYVVTGTGQGRRDFNHIERNMRPDAKASILDISSAFGVLAAIGPRSRELLEAVAEGDFSNEAAPTTSNHSGLNGGSTTFDTGGHTPAGPVIAVGGGGGAGGRGSVAGRDERGGAASRPRANEVPRAP